MPTKKLADLIGQEITELRYQYNPRDAHDLQWFQAYLKMGDGSIINIPSSEYDLDYSAVTPQNAAYLQAQFAAAATVGTVYQQCINGQKITSIFRCYHNNEPDSDHRVYMQLANGYYLTENHVGPIGLTDIDLLLLDEQGFRERNAGLLLDARPVVKR